MHLGETEILTCNSPSSSSRAVQSIVKSREDGVALPDGALASELSQEERLAQEAGLVHVHLQPASRDPNLATRTARLSLLVSIESAANSTIGDTGWIKPQRALREDGEIWLH